MHTISIHTACTNIVQTHSLQSPEIVVNIVCQPSIPAECYSHKSQIAVTTNATIWPPPQCRPHLPPTDLMRQSALSSVSLPASLCASGECEVRGGVGVGVGMGEVVREGVGVGVGVGVSPVPRKEGSTVSRSVRPLPATGEKISEQ